MSRNQTCTALVEFYECVCDFSAVLNVLPKNQNEWLSTF